jgi:DNA-binding XRE family transcriptional regulator
MRTIKTLREAQSLTQQELANAIGVTRQTITAWEAGVQRPRLYLPQVQELCRILCCDVKEIDVEERNNAETET